MNTTDLYVYIDQKCWTIIYLLLSIYYYYLLLLSYYLSITTIYLYSYR